MFRQNSFMGNVKFFDDLVAAVPLPVMVADSLREIYVTKKAFYQDIDKAGPEYSELWRRNGLKERQVFNLRLTAIRLREEKRKKNQCSIC